MHASLFKNLMETRTVWLGMFKSPTTLSSMLSWAKTLEGMLVTVRMDTKRMLPRPSHTTWSCREIQFEYCSWRSRHWTISRSWVQTFRMRSLPHQIKKSVGSLLDQNLGLTKGKPFWLWRLCTAWSQQASVSGLLWLRSTCCWASNQVLLILAFGSELQQRQMENNIMNTCSCMSMIYSLYRVMQSPYSVTSRPRSSRRMIRSKLKNFIWERSCKRSQSTMWCIGLSPVVRTMSRLQWGTSKKRSRKRHVDCQQRMLRHQCWHHIHLRWMWLRYWTRMT